MPKAVAFHGYRSSPSNITWLTRPLAESGFEVVAPSIRDVDDGYEAGVRELPVAVAAGHSMGGTVALLLAARNPGSVNCVVAVAAPVDRRLQLQYLLQSDDPYMKKLANHLASLGGKLEQTSPSRYIGNGMPPVLYIRGSADNVVPRIHVDILAGLSDKLNFPLEVVEIEGMGHSPQREEHIHRIADAVKKFVGRCGSTQS
ncbi:MAG: alpha/beta hydrolase family protein [Pyrobaculum sp.]